MLRIASVVIAVINVLLLSINAHARCQASELPLSWPIGGSDSLNWVINNYVDLDNGTGIRDYRGGMKTYNGHNGIDIDLANFRAMDSGWPALAAAPGRVIEVQHDLFDRNFEGAAGCGPWNHVYIEHDNGYITWYGHLKFGSVRVRVGDRVTAGQNLGDIGSSGCSSTAHLHFEVRSCTNTTVDPFLQNMWSRTPAYDTALGLMDVAIRKGGFPNNTTDALIKDPAPNAFRITPGTRIGVGLSMAGGQNNDRVDVRILRPNGTSYVDFSPVVLNQAQRHWWPRWWVNMPNPMDDGNYVVQVRLNNRVVSQKNVARQPTGDAAFFAVTDETYRQTFLSLNDAGYTASVVDGSPAIEGGARFTGVYRHNQGGYRTDHNIDYNTYARIYQEQRNAGRQLLSIDNYIRNGVPMIASVFGNRWSNDWVGYHFSTPQQHQEIFNRLRGQGYRPYIISVAYGQGRYWISSAYTRTPSAGWTALYGLTLDQYQQEFNRQAQAGRGLDYIDIYQDGSVPKVSAIWTVEAGRIGSEVRHGLGEANFHFMNEQQQARGRRLKWVTSYMEGGQRKFAGIWRTTL